MKKYTIKTYGCQMNVHESEKIAGILAELDFVVGADEKESDIIVFNTCCIRETAESKILGHIGRVKCLKKLNPNLIVVVCGCMSQQDDVAETLSKKFPFIDIVLGTHNIHQLKSKLLGLRKKHQSIDIEKTDGYIAEGTPIDRTSFPNAWVNIIYGCNNFCTYCIVPFVRGRERSRNMNDVVCEVEKLVQSGYKEITLLGQNVNSYGKDLNDGSCFASLLEKIAKIEGHFWIKFMTNHPKDFTDDILDAMQKHPKICRHIHLPVQAGSTKVLTLMNRKYTKSDYLSLVQKIKNALPDVGLTSDIMVGFNGETEEDFLETLDLVAQVKFSSAFCFVYSPRSGTAGFSMPEAVSEDVKTNRIKRLIALQNKITRENSSNSVGKVLEVLTTSKKENLFSGRTACGKFVSFESEKDEIGNFVKVQITKGRSAFLHGNPVKE